MLASTAVLASVLCLACQDTLAPRRQFPDLPGPVFSQGTILEGQAGVFACWSGGNPGDTAFFRVAADGGTLLTQPDLEPFPAPNEVTFAIPYVPGGYVAFCAVPWVQESEPFDPDPTTVTITQIGTTSLRTDSVTVYTISGLAAMIPPDTVVTMLVSSSNPGGAVIYYDSQGQLVPTTPPDSIPRALLADSNLVASQSLGLRWPRDLIVIMFSAGSTQAQRDSAVSAVGGQVVGGRPMNDDGFFLVQIEHDGTDGPLQAAIAQLQQMPQIRLATEYFVSDGLSQNYLRPNDGSGWQQADWGVLAGRARGSNWGLERIELPLAWGCEVGNANTPVAVLDHGLHPHSDLAANLNSGLSYGLGAYPTDTTHATQVASVLAAVGDNDTAITGGAWRANLRMRELYPLTPTGQPDTIRPDATLFGIQLDAAIKDGARVVNMSTHPWDPKAPPPYSSADSARVLRAYSQIGLAMELATASTRPLVVSSAGNDNNGFTTDAFWWGTAILQDSFPNYTLVVAASNIVDQLPTWSGRGRWVEVAAPGVNMTALNGSGTTATGLDGTSFAAPLVSAIASLLMSFDPRLTVPEVKQLIVEGAINSGLTAGGIPIVNAYESLKLAAKRMGAPVCGNVAWGTYPEFMPPNDSPDHDIVIQRDSSTVDTVATNVAAFGFHDYVQTYHGGRRIGLYDGIGSNPAPPYFFVLNNGQWVGTSQAGNETLTGSSRSAVQHASGTVAESSTSHDGDTVLVRNPFGSGSKWLDLVTPSGTHRLITFPAGMFPTSAIFSPVGDYAAVVIADSVGAQLIWSIRSVAIPSGNMSTMVSGTPQVVAGYGHLAFSEDGSELLVAEHTRQPTSCNIWDVGLDSQGRIYVVDVGSSHVKVFGMDGRYIRPIGRRGRGPGEFETPMALGIRPGDTLTVFDVGLSRLTEFSPDGQYLRQKILEAPNAVTDIEYSPDGSTVLVGFSPITETVLHVLDHNWETTGSFGAPAAQEVPFFWESVLGGYADVTKDGHVVYSQKSPFELRMYTPDGETLWRCTGLEGETTPPASVVRIAGTRRRLEWDRFIHSVGIFALSDDLYLNVICDPTRGRRRLDIIDRDCRHRAEAILDVPFGVRVIRNVNGDVLAAGASSTDVPEVAVYRLDVK